MRQWNFDVNIEKRNPLTGNVYYISRMTSDWAERHPLNVDQFIEDVYREFEGTEFEESREALRRVWAATLSMPIQGDKTVYPNQGGAHRPAAMKVWHTAGDYWRKGFRTGDTLPAMVPGHTITRLPEGGWICLFPMEMHLIDECKAEDGKKFIEVADAAVTEPENNQADEEPTIEAPAIEPAETPAPIEANANGEATDPRDAQIAELQARIAELEQQATVAPVIEPVAHQASTAPAETPAPVAVAAPQPTERERNAARRRQRREAREAQQRSYEDRLAREAREAEEYARQQERRKIFAAIAAAAVTLVLIYFFGLLGPAIFGLLAGGLLKG